MPDLTDAEVASADFGTYTAGQFFDDMGRVTEYRTDPELCELLVSDSRDDPALDARPGRAVHADLGPAGLSGRTGGSSSGAG